MIVLLGAGASRDAGAKTSIDMIGSVETYIQGHRDWTKFAPLYNYVKAATYYRDGVVGKFGDAVQYNIEVLVNTLYELERNTEHVIYPFIGTWSPRLHEVLRGDFSLITQFRTRIIEALRSDWIMIDDYERKASYFRPMGLLASELNAPLRVFTLNYDLCVEKCRLPGRIERGFNVERHWDWRRFDESQKDLPAIFLYKMHGSIDWLRTNGTITFRDEPGSIQADELSIIFGTNYKMQYVDPFLFFVYEFRKWTLEARMIITIGYGFGDEHINGIIGQALRSGRQRSLLAVGGGKEESLEEEDRVQRARVADIRKRLGLAGC